MLDCLSEKRFSVLKYLDRIEKAALDISENKEPIDWTIVLWWGLDGIQLNEDGTVEAVSRRKSKADSLQSGDRGACTLWADNMQCVQVPAAALTSQFLNMASQSYLLQAMSTQALLTRYSPHALQNCNCIIANGFMPGT